jgi:2-methylcitrate dehydratase PrpD
VNTTALDLDELGRQAHTIFSDELPASVLPMVRVLLVDTLGGLAGGLRYPAMRALAADLAAAGDTEFAQLMTFGSAATWLDADSGGAIHPHGDRLPPMPTAHPAPHVLPVVLCAAAAQTHNDGVLLRAFAAGTELGMRLGAGSSLRPGLHPHGIHGPAGAAVARALLGGADARTVGRAFAGGASVPLAALLAVPMAGGTVRNAWTGLGSYYGAMAGSAAIVDDGVAGDSAGGADLLTALFDGAVCTELDVGTVMGRTDLWRLLSSYLKPYACARWIHPACDALRIARQRHPGASVRAIEVTTFAFAASLLGTRPATDMAARFSLPFCLATLAVHGRISATEFVELAERIEVHTDAAYTAALPGERPTAVTVHFADGNSCAVEVRNARGNPDQPLEPDEVIEKMRANVGDLLPARMLDELAAWLRADPGSTHLLADIARVLLSGLG